MLVLAMTQLFPVNQNPSQQLFMSASDAIRSGKLAVCADPCWSPNTYIYNYIYIYVCVNILAHIHIILHKLWVSRYPAYIYWVASTYQNLDPQNPSKSNEFSCLFHKGHGATRPWGTRQSSAALPSEASPEVPGVRGLKWLAGEDWVFSWIL